MADPNESPPKWLTDIEHYLYPDDLPLPRHMKYGPQTPEIAKRFLDADYPLPGTFPPISKRKTSSPAWIEYLEKGEIYPGAKLTPEELYLREILISKFADSNYSDPAIAQEIFHFDRATGFNPIFEFQYLVLNFKKWNQVLFFELNGLLHFLSWNDPKGWMIDRKLIAKDPLEAQHDFTLFDLVAASLDNPEHYYPIIKIKKRFLGDPNKIVAELPSEPLTSKDVVKFGVRHNPMSLQEKLDYLVEDYFSQPPHIRKKDLIEINKIRNSLGLEPVDEQLKSILESSTAPKVELPKIVKKIDPHTEARQIYQDYLKKMAIMQPHRDYCKKMIRATQPHQGQTPVMPLAIMGTNNGPILCDACHEQIPLEGGRFNNVGAGDAWNNNPQRRPDWYSFIRGHVTFLEETNETFRVYHGAMTSGCGVKATRQEAQKIKQFKETAPQMPFQLRQKLDKFLLEEQGISDVEDRNRLTSQIINDLFSYDPGIGINRP